MKLHKYQKYLIISLAITIIIAGFYAIESKIVGISPPDYILLTTMFTVLVSINIVLVNFPLSEFLKINYPPAIGLLKSMIIRFLITSISAASIITIWVFIFYYTMSNYRSILDSVEYGIYFTIFNDAVVAVMVNFIICAISFVRDSTMEWKKAILEVEMHKRIGVELQYATLVNQLNPHFLFNSLNALVSLIPQSPDKAVDFVNNFSRIYRYVLDAKDKIVCEVKNEMDFMDSYCYLQKIRFSDNLIIEKQIGSEYLSQFIPPLSLQLLVENAIKHNEVSKTNPLRVKIYTQQKYIFVENSIKMKLDNTDSTGIGLNNLMERYKHLCDVKPEFYIKNNVYIAKIPIIVED